MRILIFLLFIFTALFSYEHTKLFHTTPLFTSLQKIHSSQVKAFDHEELNSDEAMQKMIKENATYFQDVLIQVKDNPYVESFIIEEEYQKRILFLKSRISLNAKQGNDYAVKRDEIELGYLEQIKQIDHYLISLSDLVQGYASKHEIEHFAEKMREKHQTAHNENFSDIYTRVLHDDNPVARAIRENFKSYVTLAETYNRLLEFTQSNARLLSQKTIFTLINYADIINKVNSYPAAQWVNRQINFLYLNSGKLVSLLLISTLLGLSFYLSKGVLRLRLLNFTHYENSKLLRPIRLFLGVIALDYLLLTLMYPLQPTKFWESVSIFANIAAFTYFSMELIAYIVIGYFETKESSKNEKALVSLSIDMLKSILAIAAFVYFLNRMGVGLQTVLTSLGIFGVGIALAAKDSIANLFGSLNLLLDNTFSQGDFITIGTLEGEVVKVGLRSTQIRAFDNSLIIMPNAEAALKPIINWSKRRLGREIKTSIAVSYNTPPQTLRNVIDDIRYLISQHPDLVQHDDIVRHEESSNAEVFVSKKHLLGLKKDHFVYLDRFDPSHLSILVQAFSRTTEREEWHKVKENLLFSIWEILQKNEIEFALPGQKLFLSKFHDKT